MPRRCCAAPAGPLLLLTPAPAECAAHQRPPPPGMEAVALPRRPGRRRVRGAATGRALRTAGGCLGRFAWHPAASQLPCQRLTFTQLSPCFPPCPQVLLGQKTSEYESISADAGLEPPAPGTAAGGGAGPHLPWRQVWRALNRGDLRLKGQVGRGCCDWLPDQLAGWVGGCRLLSVPCESYIRRSGCWLPNGALSPAL